MVQFQINIMEVAGQSWFQNEALTVGQTLKGNFEMEFYQTVKESGPEFTLYLPDYFSCKQICTTRFFSTIGACYTFLWEV